VDQFIHTDILAVVVSHNGGAKLLRGIDALRGQVGHVCVVDNGSAPESLAVLDSLEGQERLSVIRLAENRGVGHALNLGVRRAHETGYAWLLTMDQDSVVDRSLIRAYVSAVNRDPSLVSLSPAVSEKAEAVEPSEVVPYAITSGNLVRVGLFDRIGSYDEGFFVDCIDFDFCLRLRRAGYSIHRVAGARMQHELGEPVKLPRFLRNFYARHSPSRRYFMSRNYLYLARRYVADFPWFILKLGILQALLFCLVGVLDPHPLRSYRAIIRGVRDYVAGIQGPYLESAQ
jgi:rhamnosyltransferase